MPDTITAKIASGQHPGSRGGCKLQLARELGAAALSEVQKVSNLILNMNLYVAGTADPKLNFTHSVAIRGNTDES